MDVANTYTDASEVSPGAIDCLWRTGWNTQQSLQIAIHPFKLNIAMLAQSAGSLTLGYGFDFSTDTIIQSVNMQSVGAVWDQSLWDAASWGSQTDVVRDIFLLGRGNAFQMSLSNGTAAQAMTIHGYTVTGKKSGQKVFQVV